MSETIIHTDNDGDQLLVTTGNRDMGLVYVGTREAGTDRVDEVRIPVDEAPRVAAQLASALTGEEMVVVPKKVIASAEELLRRYGNLITADSLRAALGPEPCPAVISIPSSIVYVACVRCTLPKGHTGDHVAPKEAWTNG